MRKARTYRRYKTSPLTAILTTMVMGGWMFALFMAANGVYSA